MDNPPIGKLYRVLKGNFFYRDPFYDETFPGRDEILVIDSYVLIVDVKQTIPAFRWDLKLIYGELIGYAIANLDWHDDFELAQEPL